MRVLFYVDTGGSTGGPGMHSVRIWKALAARHPDLVGPLVVAKNEADRRIFAAQIGDPNVRELEGGAALVDASADPVEVRPSFFAELCALARRERCDHIHVLWGFLHPAQVDAVPREDRVPVTVTLCDATAKGESDDVDAMFFGSDRWERYLREALRVPAGYLAISEKTRRDARTKDVGEHLVETVHLWVDPALAKARVAKREDYVVYVGAFAEYKGVGHILDFALAYPEYPIKMAGYESADFPIEWSRYSSVEHLGYLPSYADVVSLISRARALLFLSYSEGFGLPMLEAQTLGVPLVVNPRNPLVAELLPRGSYVSAGNVGSPTSLKAAIDVATRDADDLIERGLASAARFSEDVQVKKTFAAIERHHARLRSEGWSR